MKRKNYKRRKEFRVRAAIIFALMILILTCFMFINPNAAEVASNESCIDKHSAEMV